MGLVPIHNVDFDVQETAKNVKRLFPQNFDTQAIKGQAEQDLAELSKELVAEGPKLDALDD